MCNVCTRDIEPQVPPEPKEVKTNSTIEKYKRKHNIITNPLSEEVQKEVEYQPDLLAVSVQHTKLAYDLVKQYVVRFQETKTYVTLTKTSQPIHIAFAIIVIAIWMNSSPCGNIRGWKALYVGAVATHFGSQIWMTLVSGIVLYFSLPRHEFGRVQAILFPVYYAFNSLISLTALLSYFRIQCITQFNNTSWIQLVLLLTVFSIEAYVRLGIVKPMLHAKHIKTHMEDVAGNGQEVGRLVLGELAHCPRYIRVLKAFRTYHSAVAMGTMICLGCSLYSTMIIVDGLC